ncbi:hypothetical protein [Rhodopila sp.]|uniref:hypothetical protein n=1 Tax=Rhodopila sp. TaxID=2480087 RepID=UPI003D14719B
MGFILLSGGMTEGIERLASLIAGNAPRPDWLHTALRRAIAALRYGIQSEGQIPGRQELRKQLTALRKAAADIAAALDHPPVIRALAALAPVDEETDRQMFQAVTTLIDRTATVLGEIPAGKGRNKFNPNRTPHEICALAICLIWNRSHGEEPRYATSASNEACNQLWRLAGGELQDNSNNLQRWQDRIQAANAVMRSGGDASARQTLFG